VKSETKGQPQPPTKEPPLHHSHENGVVGVTGLGGKRLDVDGSVARGEIAEGGVVVGIPVMALVEVEGVTHWVILVLGHALGGTVAVELPNEGLPPGARHDLRPLAKLLERPQATRPPPVTG